jgi:hypothetical protein
MLACVGMTVEVPPRDEPLRFPHAARERTIKRPTANSIFPAC